MIVAGAVRCLSLLSLLIPPSVAVECVLNHAFTVDRYKDIRMVKSKCHANKYCVAVHYEDKNPMKKQGYSMGCDRTDCEELEYTDGWTTENGQICKKHRDYGTAGRICCCKTHLCNGVTSKMTTLSLLLLLISWVLA